MAQRLADGSQFDTFRIVRLIDKGGMGEVYEAYEDLLHRKVALKIIALNTGDESSEKTVPEVTHEIIDLFIREGRALAKLNHPNVVTIYRLGCTQDMHYIVMEYVEGVSLQTLINKKEIDKTQILRIFEKILRGTKAFHDKNIIHRDLKPRNILITKDNNIKIVDFGIATNSDSKKENKGKKVVGSTHYIPPEVLRGERPTFQSDIWNLGIIFYEILTYDKPHVGSTEKEISKKTQDEDIRFSFTDRFSVPSQLQKIILKMCQREPQDRYESVQDILEDFLEFVESLRAQQPVTNTRGAIVKKSNKNKMTYIAAGLVFLAFTGFVKYAQNEKGKESESEIAEESAPDPAITAADSARQVAAVAEPLSESEQIATSPPTKDPADTNRISSRKKKNASRRKHQQAAKSQKPIVKQQKLAVQKPIAQKTVAQKATPKPITQKPVIPKPVVQKPVVQKSVAQKSVEKMPERSIASIAPTPIEKLLVPQLTSPIDKISVPNQGTIVTPIVFNWSKIDGAKTYKIEFSMTKNFSEIIYETTLTQNQHIFDQSLSPGTVFWRVRAIGKDNNESSWSEPRTFIIDQ